MPKVGKYGQKQRAAEVQEAVGRMKEMLQSEDKGLWDYRSPHLLATKGVGNRIREIIEDGVLDE